MSPISSKSSSFYSARRQAFKALHASGCFILPNPWDAGSARYLQGLGFRALATTSSGYAWSRGRPDGAATDAEGCYWSAGVSAQRLNRFAADGRLLASYPVPVAAPTMPCFGGKDFRTLYLTSLRHRRDPALLARYPLTGITLAAPSPVAGAAVSLFEDG